MFGDFDFYYHNMVLVLSALSDFFLTWRTILYNWIWGPKSLHCTLVFFNNL